MRIVALFLVVVGLGVVSALGQQPPAASRLPASVYVSEFVSRSITDKALLTSFTDLFETALVNSGPHRVLNRRNLQKVLAEAQNESYVASMRDVSTQARARIPVLEGAEGVIFGEVTDDADSGEVSITVTLESFDSVMHWKRSVSMMRGRLRDLASRRETMEGLVRTDAGSGIGQRNSTLPEARQQVPRGEAAAGASGRPVTPNERIRATLDQFAMSPNKRRASLTMIIENQTRELVSLALENDGQRGRYLGGTKVPVPKVSLSDDRAATWYVQSVVGLRVVPCCYRILSEVRQEDFTVLGPADQVRVVIVFSDTEDGIVSAWDRTPKPPATLFSFTADALYYLAAGPERVSIQLPSIKAPR